MGPHPDTPRGTPSASGQIPNTNQFIDGNWRNSPLGAGNEAARPRFPAIFANHSSKPNAQFQRRYVDKPTALELRHRMVLVALEPIRCATATHLSCLGVTPPSRPCRRLVAPPPC
jgi:hypothetical protein